MKLGFMGADFVAAEEFASLGLVALQLFFGHGAEGEKDDPPSQKVDDGLAGAALAAMTLHVDLVGTGGLLPADVERTVRCVAKTAALSGRFGDNERPLLVWHPSPYPEEPGAENGVIFAALVEALSTICHEAERSNVDVALEITRGGSVGSAETFLHLKERVGSPALRVCMDAANFTPDRTPLERSIRMLGPEIAIAHGKDVRFDERGEACDYGPTGSGTMDYGAYMRYLKECAQVPYFVLEYYRTRDDLLKAIEIVRPCLL